MKRLRSFLHWMPGTSRHGQARALALKRRRRMQSLIHPVPATETRRRFSPVRLAIGIGTATLLSLLLCIHLIPNHIAWRVGDTADREVVAPRTVRYVDTEATRLLREAAALQVEKRYEPIPGATAAAIDTVRILFEAMEEVTRTPAPSLQQPVSPARQVVPPSSVPSAVSSDNAATNTASAQTPPVIVQARRIVAIVRQQTGMTPPEDDIALLLQQKPAIRQKARETTLRLVSKEMSRAITQGTDELAEIRTNLMRSDALDNLPTRALRESVAAVAGSALMPTRRYDVERTEQEQQTAQVAVPPQTRRLTAGTVLIRPNEQVTQQHLDQFAALGLQSNRLDATSVLVITLLVFCFVGLTTAYLRQYHPDLYRDTPRLFLLCLLSVISVTGLKTGAMLLGVSLLGTHFGFLGMMCVASAGMVISLLLCPRVALLIVALLSAMSGIVLNNELRFALVTLGSSLTGILAVSSLRNRTDLLRAAVLLCCVNAVLNVLVGQLEGDLPRELILGAMWGVVSGVFALALFYFGVALFEKWFNLTTHLRLLELSDPATPILQEFRLRVPGTYAHSLMVSNLAHAAAEAIRADALLVRVAAYYHDIGKMNRPEFFIENQSSTENIHDRLSPSLSAIILASHVKEGVEIAEEIGLPPRVRELIQQHHGTTLMKFFYHRAAKDNPNPMLEAQFRYPGPKPQTKEAAILMLADSVEAASRTLVKPTPARIREFVGKIIEDKRSDDQLEECDLTLRDLATIHDVFTRTLSGALHARIEYPEDRKPAVTTAHEIPPLGIGLGIPPLPETTSSVTTALPRPTEPFATSPLTGRRE